MFSNKIAQSYRKQKIFQQKLKMFDRKTIFTLVVFALGVTCRKKRLTGSSV